MEIKKLILILFLAPCFVQAQTVPSYIQKWVNAQIASAYSSGWKAAIKSTDSSIVKNKDITIADPIYFTVTKTGVLTSNLTVKPAAFTGSTAALQSKYDILILNFNALKKTNDSLIQVLKQPITILK